MFKKIVLAFLGVCLLVALGLVGLVVASELIPERIVTHAFDGEVAREPFGEVRLWLRGTSRQVRGQDVDTVIGGPYHAHIFVSGDGTASRCLPEVASLALATVDGRPLQQVALRSTPRRDPSVRRYVASGLTLAEEDVRATVVFAPAPGCVDVPAPVEIVLAHDAVHSSMSFFDRLMTI